MLRFIIRALGYFALAGAFGAAIVDAARSLANGAMALTSLGATLAYAAPAKLRILPALASHLGAWLWDPVLITLLRAPTSATLALLGLLLILAARPQEAR